MAAVQQAKQRGLTVSCDLNFRKKLWNWKPGTGTTELAQQTLQGLMPYVDVVIANEEDADKMLGIRADNTDVEAGQISVAAYEDVARQIVARYSNVSQVAITLRESLSASHNNWGAMLFDVARNRSFACAVGWQRQLPPLRNPQHHRPRRRRRLLCRRLGLCAEFAGIVRSGIGAAVCGRRQLPETQHQR